MTTAVSPPHPEGDTSLENVTLDDRYVVGRALGAGGMATVYLAQDTRLDRSVVVKVPHPSLVAQKGFLARFEHEIRNLTRVEHQHVVKVIDTGTHGKLPYAVLQYLAGGSLKDRLVAGGGKLEAVAVLPWLLQIADALDHMHGRGLVHRDVKPGNILYDDAGNVVLADFGIAKAIGGMDTQITATGVTPGSPGYMAPEAMRGVELGPAYDQFSLGVMVFEALSGRLPFDGTTAMELLGNLMHKEPRDLASLVPEIPVPAAEAVMKALSRDPSKRFSTCTEFAKSFQAALGVQTIQVFPRQFAAALRRKRWLRVGTAAAAIVAAVAIGWFARPGATATETPPKEPPSVGETPASKRDLGEPPWKLVVPEGGPPWAKVSQLQIDEAKKLDVPVAFENSIGMRFVLIPAGKFVMGTPKDDSERSDDEEDAREATVPRAFYLQTTETTNGQYRRWNAQYHSPQIEGADADADELPTANVSLVAAQRFLDAVGPIDGRKCRLPTELEWEYACRGGSTNRYFWGEDLRGIGRFANACDRCAKTRWPKWVALDDVDDGFAGPSPAGSFLPNPYGLYDMVGNAIEWCTIGDGSRSGSDAAQRGGSWDGMAYSFRSSFRLFVPSDKSSSQTRGFRALMELPAPPSVEIASPADAAGVDEGLVLVRGTTNSPEKTVRVNGVTGDVRDGAFEVATALPPGEQEIEVVSGKVSAIRKVKVAAVPRPEAGWPGVPAWAKVSKQQVDEAKRLGVPVAFENPLGMRFVLVPAGRFFMGTPEDEPGHRTEEQLHPVILSRPFYLSITEFTNGQARRRDPSFHSEEINGEATDGDDQPTVGLTFADMRAVAAWAGKEEPTHVYRLPTEAEWEYACRAGTTTRWYWGDDPAVALRHENVADACGKRKWSDWGNVFEFDDGFAATAPVAHFEPNPWGIHDLLGNLAERCADTDGPLATTPVIDPVGTAPGTKWIVRGGLFKFGPGKCRTTFRTALPDERFGDIGLRLVADLPQPR